MVLDVAERWAMTMAIENYVHTVSTMIDNVLTQYNDDELILHFELFLFY
jgi:mannitol-1-phosphate/altronate dehydrogenase